tara:strand:- start:4869 stop:5756 length:888 start_codon:yes stop_codon:yes gene_type:complete
MEQTVENITLTIEPDGRLSDPHSTGEPALQRANFSNRELNLLNGSLRSYNLSRNELINASAELLALCATLSRFAEVSESSVGRSEISRAIIDLKYKVVRLDYPPSVAENLCLMFAIVIDEFILISDWGRVSGWENRTLVAELFGFRDGGDRFYRIADRALMQPKALREFLQILYIFLKLDYRGRYLNKDEQDREILIDRIETSLRQTNDVKEALHSVETPVATKPPTSYMSFWRKVSLATACVLIVALFMTLGQFVEERRQANIMENARTQNASGSSGAIVFSSETGQTTIQAVK